MKIAVIPPLKQQDYLTDTIIDGLIGMEQERDGFEWKISSNYPCRFPVGAYCLSAEQFLEFAKTADYIFFAWGNNNSTDYRTAKKVGRWDKTVFIDGSELGGNLRFDFNVQLKILQGKYKKRGEVIKEMYDKCLLYCRREKPYLESILPLPYGIETRYTSHVSKSTPKDIDFVCIFGNLTSPMLRQNCIIILKEFCKKHDLICHTEPTENQDEFYKLLARAKVGVSVGGGGFDTARFWEVLGNRCILLTETIDIFPIGSNKLNYPSIFQFQNLYDFVDRLEQLKPIISDSKQFNGLVSDYDSILAHHSSMARVKSIFTRLAQL